MKRLVFALALSLMLVVPAFAGPVLNTASNSGSFSEVYGNGGPNWSAGGSSYGEFSGSAQAYKIPWLGATTATDGKGYGQTTANGGQYHFTFGLSFPGFFTNNSQIAGSNATATTFSCVEETAAAKGLLPITSACVYTEGSAGQSNGNGVSFVKPDGSGYYAAGGNSNGAIYKAGEKDWSIGLFKASSDVEASGLATVKGYTEVGGTITGITGVIKTATAWGITANEATAIANCVPYTNVQGGGAMNTGVQVIGQNPGNWANASSAGTFSYNNTGHGFATGSGFTTGYSTATIQAIPHGQSSSASSSSFSYSK